MDLLLKAEVHYLCVSLVVLSRTCTRYIGICYCWKVWGQFFKDLFMYLFIDLQVILFNNKFIKRDSEDIYIILFDTNADQSILKRKMMVSAKTVGCKNFQQ